MEPARSGELSVELGRPRAQREQGVLKERQRSGKAVTANCHCQACDSPCVKCPTPLRLVGLRTVALTLTRRTGGLCATAARASSRAITRTPGPGVRGQESGVRKP